MYYLSGALVAFIIAIVILRQRQRKRKLLRDQELASRWGSQKKAEFNFNDICRYTVFTRNDTQKQLHDRTLSDCSFYDVFPIIDRTTSSVGQQFLFSKLVRPVKDSTTLKEFNNHVEAFRSNEELRTRLTKELFKLQSEDAYFISSLFKDRLLEKPWWFNLAYVNVGALIVFALLSLAYPPLIAVALIPVIINFLIHYWNSFNTFIFLKSLPQLSILTDVAAVINNLYKTNHSDAVATAVKELKPLQWRLTFLNSRSKGSVTDDLGSAFSYFIELLKAVILLEFFLLFDTIKAVDKHKVNIKLLFNFTGEIDSTISVANLRSSHYRWCTPQFNNGEKEFYLKEAYNPLVKNCVTNDLHLDGKSALITGSNMSGKSTFLRTVLLNSILAQSIYTCFASEFRSPMADHFSSIQIGDNILEGKSYYFEEVTVMKELLSAVTPSATNLFILDEVFKGTNTMERIAAAKAILTYLNKHNNIVIVASHDIELVEWLSSEYDLYHFDENVRENDLHFDHKIKQGPLRGGNAIRILELSGYPKEVVAEARELVNTLEIASPDAKRL